MRYTIEHNGELVPVEITALDEGQYQITLGDGEPRVIQAHTSQGMVHVLADEASHSVVLGTRGQGRHLHAEGFELEAALLDARALRRAAAGAVAEGVQVISSPMPGKVVAVLVSEGQPVAAGDGLVIVEAMKMENELRAETDGVITSVSVSDGDLVEGQTELLRIGPVDEA